MAICKNHQWCASQCRKTSILLPHKIFSSNQSRVKFFSKKLISRNFCNKAVAAKFRNFHTVSRKLHFSVKSAFLPKKLLKSWFHELFFRWERNVYRFSKVWILFFDTHSVEITKFCCHSFVTKIPWNQLFTKELYSRLIWRKKIYVEGSEFFVFPHNNLFVFQTPQYKLSTQNLRSHLVICQIIYLKKIHNRVW